ncbi:MAG: nuclear transport factor 2 family protein [Maribacter sp.]|nr:nuclear transport factor 2 family protein [Maribacter sp.]
MKQISLGLFLIFQVILNAQTSENEAIRKTIETFFEGFHNQDSLLIKQTVSEAIVLQTIARDPAGKSFVKTENFGDFLKAIVGIPETTHFRELIKEYSIQIDGPMANAWTRYEFILNDTFHHCGVNSFQLFNDGQGWKIIYLIDTRRNENCE